MALSPWRSQSPLQVLFFRNIFLEAKRGQGCKDMLGDLLKVIQSVRHRFIIWNLKQTDDLGEVGPKSSFVRSINGKWKSVFFFMVETFQSNTKKVGPVHTGSVQVQGSAGHGNRHQHPGSWCVLGICSRSSAKPRRLPCNLRRDPGCSRTLWNFC